jgi:hypothetical protein
MDTGFVRVFLNMEFKPKKEENCKGRSILLQYEGTELEHVIFFEEVSEVSEIHEKWKVIHIYTFKEWNESQSDPNKILDILEPTFTPEKKFKNEFVTKLKSSLSWKEHTVFSCQLRDQFYNAVTGTKPSPSTETKSTETSSTTQMFRWPETGLGEIRKIARAFYGVPY